MRLGSGLMKKLLINLGNALCLIIFAKVDRKQKQELLRLEGTLTGWQLILCLVPQQTNPVSGSWPDSNISSLTARANILNFCTLSTPVWHSWAASLFRHSVHLHRFLPKSSFHLEPKSSPPAIYATTLLGLNLFVFIFLSLYEWKSTNTFCLFLNYVHLSNISGCCSPGGDLSALCGVVVSLHQQHLPPPVVTLLFQLGMSWLIGLMHWWLGSYSYCSAGFSARLTFWRYLAVADIRESSSWFPLTCEISRYL